jgi:hypothetical protein
MGHNETPWTIMWHQLLLIKYRHVPWTNEHQQLRRLMLNICTTFPILPHPSSRLLFSTGMWTKALLSLHFCRDKVIAHAGSVLRKVTQPIGGKVGHQMQFSSFLVLCSSWPLCLQADQAAKSMLNEGLQSGPSPQNTEGWPCLPSGLFCPLLTTSST